MPELLATVPPLPRALRLPTLIVSGLLGLSALWLGGIMLWRALFQGDPNWPGLGFESVILVAAGFGVAAGLGWFREGPGMALACVIACVVVGSGLGRLTVVQDPGGVLRDGWFLARIAMGGALGLIATVAVVGRHPRGFRTLAVGVGLTIALLAISGGAWAGRGLFTGSGGAMLAVARTVGGLVLAVVIGALLCASVHYLVRAFELGRARDDAPPAP